MTLGLPPVTEFVATRRPQMFPALTEAQITRVAAFGQEKSFAAGQIVFEQGDVKRPFYVVLEGELEVVHPRDAIEELITIHGPGEFTGEVSALTERRGLVRGRAKTSLRLLSVEYSRLRALIQDDSDLSEIVMRAYILRRLGLLAGGYSDVVVIGSRDSAATLRVQAFLMRNGHPSRYVDVDRDPDVQSLLDQFHVDVAEIPIVICR